MNLSGSLGPRYDNEFREVSSDQERQEVERFLENLYSREGPSVDEGSGTLGVLISGYIDGPRAVGVPVLLQVTDSGGTTVAVEPDIEQFTLNSDLRFKGEESL